MEEFDIWIKQNPNGGIVTIQGVTIKVTPK